MLDFNELEGNYFYSMFEEVTFDEEMSAMEKLVYAWQQNTRDFLKYTPKHFLEYFISQFKESKREYYRGLMFDVGEELVIDKEIELVASTTKLSIANSIFIDIIDKPKRVVVFKVNGERELNVRPFRDMGERERILYKPQYLEVVENKIVYPLCGHSKKALNDKHYKINFKSKDFLPKLIDFCKSQISEEVLDTLVGKNDLDRVLQYIDNKTIK